MALLTVNTESVKKEGGSDYIKKSGIFDLTLKHAEITKTTNGATQVNYLFDKAMSYGNTIFGVDGKPIFGYNVLEALAVTLGEEELSEGEPTTVTFKKGSKELNCIPELNDVAVKAWIQISYRMWNGEIRENVAVKRFYRVTDGAAGSEIIDDAGFGDRLAKDSVVAEEIKYEDGVTPEAVAAWKAAEQSGGSAAAPTKKASGGFPGAKKSSGFPGSK